MASSAPGDQGSPGRLQAPSGSPAKLISHIESRISSITSVDEVRGLPASIQRSPAGPGGRGEWRSARGVLGADSLSGETVLAEGYQLSVEDW